MPVYQYWPRNIECVLRMPKWPSFSCTCPTKEALWSGVRIIHLVPSDHNQNNKLLSQQNLFIWCLIWSFSIAEIDKGKVSYWSLCNTKRSSHISAIAWGRSVSSSEPRIKTYNSSAIKQSEVSNPCQLGTASQSQSPCHLARSTPHLKDLDCMHIHLHPSS